MLADLCCGNGLITVRLAQRCAAVVGIDYSRELIAVARRDYAGANVTYHQRSAEQIGPGDFPPPGLNKVVMNQGLQYFDEAMLRGLLGNIEAFARGETRLVFTDVPDVARLTAFYDTPERWAAFERPARPAKRPWGPGGAATTCAACWRTLATRWRSRSIRGASRPTTASTCWRPRAEPARPIVDAWRRSWSARRGVLSRKVSVLYGLAAVQWSNSCC
uniref:Class I SAM-dependent methyltransferase n=1 Tax=Phenylobacterium glaciei TaxID=2803784 RepID=A0A974P3K6_9CAUL|nr:class I SAM-dependent methyltransferase [Phenylobacterium glaciei]